MRIYIKEADIDRIRIDAKTSDGIPLFIEISSQGLDFFVTESSAGHSHDKPIRRSVDELWEWIKNEGDRVPLRNRAVVKRARAKTSA